jgi:hypothetical protein
MKILIYAAMACLAAALIGLGCSDESTNAGGQNPPTQKSIGPEGGTIEINGQMTLSIPPGALADTVDFTVTRNNAPTPPGGTRSFVSNCFSIEPGGTAFVLAAALTIDYDPANLGSADERTILVYSHDSTGWLPLATTIDPANDRAGALINHLCDFTAMVDSSASLHGSFAALAVGRSISILGSVLFRMDMYVARLDSFYAPCNPISPQQADSVTCNGTMLTWEQSFNGYEYSDILNPVFIQLGASYTFRIKGNAAIPDLTSSIDFPADEPYVTSPANNDTLSLSGFDVAWADSGEGIVRFILMRETDSTNVMIETQNDGSYSFTGSQLSGLQAGDYGLLMIHQNGASINAPGYDSRSFIWARVMNATMIHLR